MSEIQPAPRTFRWTHWITCTLLSLTTLATAIRLFRGVDHYAVNILYWDQWNFWRGIFWHQSYRDLFWYTHAHRQGLGFVITALLAQYTGWNTRTECFMIAGFLFAALVAALALRRTLFGRWEWTDLLWPVVFFSTIMLKAFVQVPNLSHGIMPLLLLLLFCLCLSIRRREIAYPLLLIIDFNCTFTGFGVFLGIVTPIFFGLEAIAFARAHHRRALILALVALAGAILSALIFQHGFTPAAAIEHFAFPDPRWYLYPHFMALQMAYFVALPGTNFISKVVGWTLLLSVFALLFFHGRRIIQPRPEKLEPSRHLVVSQVIFTLLAFSLIFSGFCAVGRISLGLLAGQSARYLPLGMGILLGLYFHFAHLPRGLLRGASLALMTLVLVRGFLLPRAGDVSHLNAFTQGKKAWVDAYFATGSIELADQASQFPVYPDPDGIKMEDLLAQLRQQHLNLFLDAPATPHPAVPSTHPATHTTHTALQPPSRL